MTNPNQKEHQWSQEIHEERKENVCERGTTAEVLQNYEEDHDEVYKHSTVVKKLLDFCNASAVDSSVFEDKL